MKSEASPGEKLSKEPTNPRSMNLAEGREKLGREQCSLSERGEDVVEIRQRKVVSWIWLGSGFVLLFAVFFVVEFVVFEKKLPEYRNQQGDNCYYGKNNVAISYDLAAAWYRKAADQGYATAQHNLGRLYRYGRLIQRDSSQAVLLYRKAAEQGYREAQLELGYCYEFGEGVKRDVVEASSWWTKAAEQGDVSAQGGLGFRYGTAFCMSIEMGHVLSGYKRLAEQGSEYAQYNLGLFYEFGWAVPKDPDQALDWYKKSAAQGYEKAKKALERMMKNPYIE